MSGHSKWANIKFRKEIADKKKGKLFTKLAQQITSAARENSEIKLRLAIDKAKQANLPSENIERAGKRGKGQIAGVKFEEIVYEGFGPEKVAILISATTDNKNRTTAEIRNVLDKNDGKLSGSGSVVWMFEPKGLIRIITGTDADKEKIELTAIDAGADDVEAEENAVLIYTKIEDLERIKKDLEENGWKIASADISQIPKNTVKITNLESAKKILKLMDKLDNLEEVNSVSANFDIPEDLIPEVEKGDGV